MGISIPFKGTNLLTKKISSLICSPICEQFPVESHVCERLVLAVECGQFSKSLLAAKPGLEVCQRIGPNIMNTFLI